MYSEVEEWSWVYNDYIVVSESFMNEITMSQIVYGDDENTLETYELKM